MGSKIWIHKLVAIILSLVIVAGSLGINIPISYADGEESNIKQDILVSEENIDDTLIVSDEKELTTPPVLNLELQGGFVSGKGSEQEPYEISTKENLIFLSDRVNSGDSNYNDKCYKLMNNISLEGLDWIPIGTASAPFRGAFDGNCKIISDISIGKAGDSLECIGFFGSIESGSVCDLNINRIRIESKHNPNILKKNVGGLVGYIYGKGEASIANDIKNVNCMNAEFLLDWNKKFNYIEIGGLVGFSSNVNVMNSRVKSVITVINSEKWSKGDIFDIGGFCGSNEKSIIKNCGAIGDIKTNGGINIGGFIGCNRSNIKNCAANVAVEAPLVAMSVGGFAGDSSGEIINCMASGNVKGEDIYSINAGGFVGKSVQKITNCSATGNVDITLRKGDISTIGVFVGSNYRANVTNCYSSGKYRQKKYTFFIPDSINCTLRNLYYDNDLVHKVYDYNPDSGGCTVKACKGLSVIEMKAKSGEKNSLVDILNKNCESVDWNKWYIDSDSNRGFPKCISGMKEIYEVVFDSDGGSLIDTQIIEEGQPLMITKLPTKEGYVFNGMYKEKECINKWDITNDLIYKNTIIYVNWEKLDTYKVQLYMDGGEILTPLISERTGYIFKGWYKEKELVNKWDFQKDKLVKDTILYASWEKI